MTTVILDVRSLADSLSDAASTMASGAAESAPRISFATPELLWDVLTAERWTLLKAIGGAGPISIGEVAARTGRDEAAVRGDLEALLRAGILDAAGEGCVKFPYDTVKVELLLRAACVSIRRPIHRPQDEQSRYAIQQADSARLRRSDRQACLTRALTRSTSSERPIRLSCLTRTSSEDGGRWYFE